MKKMPDNKLSEYCQMANTTKTKLGIGDSFFITFLEFNHNIDTQFQLCYKLLFIHEVL